MKLVDIIKQLEAVARFHPDAQIAMDDDVSIMVFNGRWVEIAAISALNGQVEHVKGKFGVVVGRPV